MSDRADAGPLEPGMQEGQLPHQMLPWIDFLFFCSILSFGGPQLYNLEALPFTYDQYVVIELADKLYNSATVWTANPRITKPVLYLYTILE